MKNERDLVPLRPIEVACHSDADPAAIAWLDRPCVLIVWLAGIRTEMEYKRGSIAFAAARRIARAHNLVKMPRRTRWRSRPQWSRHQ